MYNFEFGSLNSNRKINLGGRTNQQDKKMLLKNTLAERKIRQENKLKNKSATKIQAFWRGRKEYEKLRKTLQKEWENDCKDIINDVDSCEIKNVINTLRKFLNFYKLSSNTEDLELMCKTLLILNKNKVEIILFPLSDDDYIEDYINQLRLFIPYCIKSIPYCQNSEKQKIFFKIIKILMTINIQPKDIIYSYEKETIHKNILNIILKAGLFNTINTLFYNIALNNNDVNIKQELKKLDLFNYSVYFLEMRNKLDIYKLYKLFIVDILTIPALPNRFDIKGLINFASHLPFVSLLEYISSNLDDIINYIENEANTYPNNNMLVNLLSNIVAFGRSLILKGSISFAILYITVINKILDKIPSHYFILNDQKNLLFNNVESDNESSDEEGEEEGSDNDTKMKEDAKDFILDQNILKWISYLWNPQDAIALYTKTINANSNNKDNEVVSSEIIAFCRLYLSLVLKIPAYSNEILSILLYTKNINLLYTLWNFANSSSLINEIINKTPIIKLISNENYSTEWYILSLFCKMLNRQLLTMGDDEFFSEQNQLNINNIVRVSIIVRNISYMIYMNYDSLNDEMMIQNSNISIANLKSIYPQLLRQLYTRDSRRKFTEDNIWIMISENEQDNLIRMVLNEENRINNNEFNDNNISNDYDMRSMFSGGIFSNDQSFLFNQHTNDNITSPTESAKDSFYKQRILILKHIPFVIPFEVRVNMFRAMIDQDKINRSGPYEWVSPVTRATIRRDRIFEDGYDQLNNLGRSLRQKIQISFINEQGLPEAGIDGGGVFKEFLTSITHQAFDMDYGLFLSTSNQCLYPNPHSYSRQSERLKYYEFLGRILGKALYEGILVDVFFASFFLSKWLGRISYLDDLPSLDENLYKGLLFIKNYQGNIEDLSLTFAIDDEQFGRAESVDLITNGSQIPVTDGNKIQYIYHMANYKLNTQINLQCKAFFRGLCDLIEPRWLQMFNQQELQTLISGSNDANVDLLDLKMNTEYSGVYDENHPTIKIFWQVVSDLTEEQKRKFIKFVTSCPRPPLLGFKTLQPKFAIRDSGNDQERLPTSSTCINLLKLPIYRTYDIMKSKLIYSISSDAGFELS
ncbi:HECT-domain-containing protein [Piromyces finnis]|uniref:HECT-type E3 ubiquitin transferase n=1 Tax=Piromyces finnis TaxID=1754191 RepID=A0A1Y1V582_9FUNG|nr:HECT-domain-containing protein [Piromyces finnis]|eukprot:ORX47544.1 HECT-domain-containing protein [Piromyces finnis]